MAETDKFSPTNAFKQTRGRKKPLIIFFLDLDDVVITHRASYGIGPGRGLFNTIDPVAMGMFNRLAEKVEKKLNADVRTVLITAKRFNRGIRQQLVRGGLKVKFHKKWRTDRDGPRRGHEVDRYVKANPRISDYVIFDDSPDFLPEQKLRHVQCEPYNGMTYQNYQQARHYFGMGPGE